MSKSIKYITQGAMIAALYVVLTMVANVFGLANAAIQIRISEALTILPYFTPVAIPGLFAGCLLSNIFTGCLPLDTIFGSIATLIGAVGTYVISNRLKHNKLSQFLAPVPPIVANVLIIPFVLAYVYHFEGSIPYFMLTVGAGELVSCGFLGLVLLYGLNPRRDELFIR